MAPDPFRWNSGCSQVCNQRVGLQGAELGVGLVTLLSGGMHAENERGVPLSENPYDLV